MKIFSFPHVVLYELMKQFEPVDLIKLSFCSKSAHAVVKTFSKVEEDLKIYSVENFGYCIAFPSQLLIGVISEANMTLLEQDPETHFRLKEWTKWFRHLHICQDVIQGFRETTNYICDLLKVPVSVVILDRERDLWMWNFAVERQEQKLKEVYIRSHFPVSAENYSSFLNNTTQILECWSRPPQDYRFDGKLPTVRNLFISNGLWITREHLLGLESPNAKLFRTRLESSDINALLRVWLDGGFANLKSLLIHGRKYDGTIFEGVRDRLEPVQRIVSYKWDSFEGFAIFDTNDFHIRGADGVVATVKLDFREFRMAVWPDSSGQRVQFV